MPDTPPRPLAGEALSVMTDNTLEDLRSTRPLERLLEDSWKTRSRRIDRRELVLESLSSLLLLALAIPLAILKSTVWMLVALLLVAAFWLNRDLYRLFLRRGGPWFAVKGFLLQQFYYLYSLFSLAAGVTIYLARLATRRADGRAKRTGL